MDEDYCNALSDQSVESDEEIRPENRGSIQPYMFEPTMTSDEAVESETTQQQDEQVVGEGRHEADVSDWYVISVLLQLRPAMGVTPLPVTHHSCMSYYCNEHDCH